MTETEINRFLHEAQGKCWHEWKEYRRIPASPIRTKCIHCSSDFSWVEVVLNNVLPKIPFYTRNWSDYGLLLEWAMKQDWWWHFVNTVDNHPRIICATDRYSKNIFNLLNPLTGSTALAEFLKEKETKNV